MAHSSQPIALPPTPITPTAPHHLFQGETSTSHDKRWHPTATWLLELQSHAFELYKNNIGLLLIAASQLFMTFMNISVKFLNDLDTPVPTLELVFVRMLITYICSVSYLIIQKIPHAVLGPPEVRLLLVFRGVSGFFGIFGIYYSLKYLSLSDAVVLTFLAPTTTAVAGYLFLHEALSRREVFAGLLSLFGVVLIARPQSLFGTITGQDSSQDTFDTNIAVDIAPTQRLIAVGVAMLGVAGSTGAYISLRAIGKRAHTLHSMSFFSSYSVLVSSIGMLALRVTPVVPTRWQWCGLLVAVGIFGFVAQILLVMGLQRETASRGTLALYVQMIFAAVFERVIFKITPSYLSLLGMTIIIGSGLYVALTKDKNPASYKRVPQVPEDIEAHEFAETTVGVGSDDLCPDESVRPKVSLNGESHVDK